MIEDNFSAVFACILLLKIDITEFENNPIDFSDILSYSANFYLSLRIGICDNLQRHFDKLCLRCKLVLN